MLGTRPDRELGKLFKCHYRVVAARRYKLGIKSTRKEPINWTKTRLGWLGKLPDVEIARRLGCTAGAIGYKRKQLAIPAPPLERPPHKWTKRQIAWMGKIADAEIARRIGRSPSLVGMKRRELGIPIARIN